MGTEAGLHESRRCMHAACPPVALFVCPVKVTAGQAGATRTGLPDALNSLDAACDASMLPTQQNRSSHWRLCGGPLQNSSQETQSRAKDLAAQVSPGASNCAAAGQLQGSWYCLAAQAPLSQGSCGLLGAHPLRDTGWAAPCMPAGACCRGAQHRSRPAPPCAVPSPRRHTHSAAAVP